VTESALTRAMQAMSGRVSWLLALGILASPLLAIVGMLLYAIYSDPAVPLAAVIATRANPSGTFTAVVEQVDNGMGFGLGMQYDEIHLLRRGEAITDHGDASPSTIFYIGGDASAAPQVRWIDDRHLAVSYTQSMEVHAEHAVTRPVRDGLVVTYQKN
jgi:hypothetical protein